MAKYMRDRDSEIFDEDQVWDAVEEDIDSCILEEALSRFSFFTILTHLDEEMQMMLYDEARNIVMEEYFVEIEDEDEEEE